MSALHQHQSATGIHTSLSSWTSLLPPTQSHPSRLSQNTGLSSLSHRANSHCVSVLPEWCLMFPCYSLNSSHPLLPLLCPQVRSLCLNCTSPLNMVLLEWMADGWDLEAQTEKYFYLCNGAIFFNMLTHLVQHFLDTFLVSLSGTIRLVYWMDTLWATKWSFR